MAASICPAFCKFLLLNGNCDIQDLVSSDDSSHLMTYCSERQDTGSRSIANRSTTVRWVNSKQANIKLQTVDYLRVIGVEVLLKLVAGAWGDFVNTWTRQF